MSIRACGISHDYRDDLVNYLRSCPPLLYSILLYSPLLYTITFGCVRSKRHERQRVADVKTTYS